jgi:hypothetical protein
MCDASFLSLVPSRKLSHAPTDFASIPQIGWKECHLSAGPVIGIQLRAISPKGPSLSSFRSNSDLVTVYSQCHFLRSS